MDDDNILYKNDKNINTSGDASAVPLEENIEPNKIEESSDLNAKATGAKLAMAVELLMQAESSLVQARQLIQTTGNLPAINFGRVSPIDSSDTKEDGRVVEGVFDGQKMIGPDGKNYSVPANYASKSKLVEGDLLKLTITSKGAFVFKQIGPINRLRRRGILTQNQGGHDYAAKVAGRSYRVLTASVTYFRGHEGDEVIILVPGSGESKWAAVENVVRAADATDAATTDNL